MTVESPQISVEPSQTKGKRLFSGEFAKAMAAKSVAKRKAEREQAEQAKAIVHALKVAAIVEPSETYRLNRLARVRAQMDKVDLELSDLLNDPKADQSRLKAILEASKVLSEQERKLDNRPDPGSHRPTATKPKRSQPGDYGPVE